MREERTKRKQAGQDEEIELDDERGEESKQQAKNEHVQDT